MSLGQSDDRRQAALNEMHDRLRDEYNRRALLGEMGEPIPESVVCPTGAGVCVDLRCRHFGCLDERLARP